MALTPKQKQVKELLDQNKTVPQIAKALKITNSGVYGHMRRMKAEAKGGTKAPAKRRTRTPAKTPTALRIGMSGPSSPQGNSSGQVDEVDVAGTIESAIAAAQDRLTFTAEEIAGHESAVSNLALERDGLVNQIERYDKALLAVNA
jgi:hypothetical protein